MKLEIKTDYYFLKLKIHHSPQVRAGHDFGHENMILGMILGMKMVFMPSHDFWPFFMPHDFQWRPKAPF